EGVVDHRLAARRDVDLGRRIGEVVLPLELADDRVLQLRHAVGGGVLGLAALDRLDGGRLDVIRRIEVRLANAEANHVPARALEILSLGGDRDGRGRLHPADGLRQRRGRHDGLLWLWPAGSRGRARYRPMRQGKEPRSGEWARATYWRISDFKRRSAARP